MGPASLSASVLMDWCRGTRTDLGPIDFQDMLDASSAYVRAVNDYDHKDVPAPWAPEMTEDEQAAADAAIEAAMDRAMGIG